MNDSQRSRFGIKSRLSAAVGVLATLTIVAGAVAWIAFGHVEHAVTSITERSIPQITLALTIAERSAEIVASAPAIMASETQEERQRQRIELDRVGNALSVLIDEWEALGIASDVALELDAEADAIRSQIAVVDGAVANQIVQAAQRRGLTERLSEIQSRFLEILEPLIDDAVFELVIGSEQRNVEASETVRAGIERDTGRFVALLSLKAEMDQVIELIRDMAGGGDTATRAMVAEALSQARMRVDDLLETVNSIDDGEKLAGATKDIFAFARTGAGEQQVGFHELGVAHSVFLGVVEPMISAAETALITTAETMILDQSAAISDFVDAGAMELNGLLVLRAEGNLAAGLLNEAANISDIDRLTPLAERFAAAAGQIDRSLATLSGRGGLEELRSTIGALLRIGEGYDNIFIVRRAELAELGLARNGLDATRAQSVEFQAIVGDLVSIAEATSAEAASVSQRNLGDARWFIIAVSVVSLLGAILVMFLYVSPRVIRPIEDITASMTALATGDTTVDIPGRDRRDELGRMAHALGVFRDITIEVQKSNLREIETARRRLSDAIESISEAFSLYDAEDRLIVCNEMYGNLVHPEIKDQITPGMRFEDILRLALARGYLVEAHGREDEWLAERLEAHGNPGPPRIMQRTDGVWIMLSERRTAEGGVVAVYSDITEMKEREAELAEKSQALEQLSNQLSKYLSPQIYQSIFSGEQSAVVAGKRKKLTVFFSDLVGFTETADRMESEDVTQILNQYLTEMSDIALAHGATIDKFVGDAIMIFFGDPVSRGVPVDAVACVKMALAMQVRLTEMAESWQSYGMAQPLRCRIGITTGYCTVGNFGSENRMDYTIIGGPVNLASRLEGAAEPGRILVSGETHGLIKDEIACEAKGPITVKGIAYPIETYNVIDTRENLRKRHGRIAEHGEKISLSADVEAMSEKERAEAARLLRRVLAEISDDEA
ncbi:MAG: HAMP domain-containing protein [Hyphomicrobiales bacterium]|nr:HAMP domain-containing protein [Hyphomicrobiales bacterium]